MIEETNSTCFVCNKRFNENNDKILLYDCGHIIHEKCMNKYCKLCNKEMCVSSILPKQKSLDIASLRKTDWKPGFFDYFKLLYRVPILIYALSFLWIGNKLLNKKYHQYVLNHFTNCIIKMFNIHIKYEGLENYDKNEKKVLVMNHVSYYDAIIVYPKIKSGAIYSSTIRNILTDILTSMQPSLCINRGEKNKNVEKIEEFVNEHNEILICPQGIFSSIDSISKFRTGAFATKYNVQPIILIFKQDVSTISYFHMLLFNRVDVKVKILPIIERKDKNALDYSEYIRKLMIIKSGLFGSNVISKDVIDKVK